MTSRLNSVGVFLFLSCLLLGGITQASFFLAFFSADYFHAFYAELKPEFALSFSVALCSFIGVLIPLWKPRFISYAFTLSTCYAVSAVLVICMPVFTHLYSLGYLSQTQSFSMLVVAFGVLGFFQSVNGGCVFAFFGEYADTQANQLAQAGAASIGLLIYCIRVICKLAFSDSQQGFIKSGYFEFGTIFVLLLLCCFLSLWFCSHSSSLRTSSPLEDRLVHEQQESTQIMDMDTKMTHYQSIDGPTVTSLDLCVPCVSDSCISDSADPVLHSTSWIAHLLPQHLYTVMQQTWPIILSLSGGLILNQCFYPGVFSVILGARDDWYIVIMFGCFAVTDTVAQWLPKWYRIFNRTNMQYFTIIQCVLLCMMVLSLQHVWLTNVWKSKLYIAILAALYGFNVGSGVCCHMIMLPEAVHEKHKKMASTLSVVLLQAGLIVASGAGWVVGYLFT